MPASIVRSTTGGARWGSRISSSAKKAATEPNPYEAAAALHAAAAECVEVVHVRMEDAQTTARGGGDPMNAVDQRETSTWKCKQWSIEQCHRQRETCGMISTAARLAVCVLDVLGDFVAPRGGSVPKWYVGQCQDNREP